MPTFGFINNHVKYERLESIIRKYARETDQTALLIAAANYYVGFQKDWEHQFAENMPLYMQVSRDNLILHLGEHHGDASPGANLFVRLHGVDALHQELSSHDYRFLHPDIVTQPWGRILAVTDPFGNRIQFCEGPHDA